MVDTLLSSSAKMGKIKTKVCFKDMDALKYFKDKYKALHVQVNYNVHLTDHSNSGKDEDMRSAETNGANEFMFYPNGSCLVAELETCPYYKLYQTCFLLRREKNIHLPGQKNISKAYSQFL